MGQKYRVGADEVARTTRKLVDVCADEGDVRVLRRETLEHLRDVVGFDDGYFMPFTQEFFTLAAPYMASFVENPSYAPDLHPAVRAAGWPGSYIDTEVYSARDRDRLPLYRELLRPAGMTSQIVALLRCAGRLNGALHLNRHDRGRPFRPADLARTREIVKLVGVLHGALTPQAGSQAADGALLASRLSPRQFQIAQLVAEGYQNGQVAARLSLSERTVRNQVSEVFKRLAVYSRAELALLYERAGLLGTGGSARDVRRVALLHRSLSDVALPSA
jgi:DNA-binding CsgD family transcriptional regulator